MILKQRSLSTIKYRLVLELDTANLIHTLISQIMLLLCTFCCEHVSELALELPFLLFQRRCNVSNATLIDVISGNKERLLLFPFVPSTSFSSCHVYFVSSTSFRPAISLSPCHLPFAPSCPFRPAMSLSFHYLPFIPRALKISLSHAYPASRMSKPNWDNLLLSLCLTYLNLSSNPERETIVKRLGRP